MLGRVLQVPEQPTRIVTLVPSQTELLADLGLDDEVVGITKFCVHPERWFRSKIRVGGTKSVHFDRVAALQPDLIIANKEENVADQVNALSRLAPVWVSDIKTLDDARQMIRLVGELCDMESRAEQIALGIEHGFTGLPTKKQRVAYCIWREPWMWAGGDTFIHDVLQRCGWINVLIDMMRYPALDLDQLQARNPDVVLLSSEPYPFREKHIAEINDKIPQARVLLVDGEMFSWYGSRLLHAPEYLGSLLSSL